MEIKEQDLIKFIELYEEEFGVRLDRDEAYKSAYSLVRLVKALLNSKNYDDTFE
jgi:hypothetical protein